MWKAERKVLALLVVLALVAAPGMAGEPRLEIDREGVRVEGLSPEALRTAAESRPDLATWRDILSVVAVDRERTNVFSANEVAALPPLLGTYVIEGEGLHFRPRYPPVPGLVLMARFDGAAWDAAMESPSATSSVSARFVVPTVDEGPRTRVLRALPAGEVPANLLRMYVEFSGPMGARQVLPHVQLLDARGEPVPLAFVEVPGGLWDPERTRLTLFIHPGRIKRGVGPHQVLGPVLVEGERYRLHVAAAARDAAGLPLVESFEVPLVVGPEDHASPDPFSWRLELPRMPEDALTVVLNEPADRALLARLPRVEDAAERAIEGRMEVDEDGLRFKFLPKAPWRSGDYRLVVPPSLEDPAGNRVDRLFEEKPEQGEGASVGIPAVRTFSVHFR